MINYVCSKCGKETQRTLEGWNLECECGGYAYNEVDDKDFNYVCSSCGHIWSGQNENEKQCPHCQALEILCYYKDDKAIINKNEYEKILDNIRDNVMYGYRCSCGSIKQLYSDTIYNVFCPNDDKLMTALPYNAVELMKEHRGLHRMSQAKLAELLNISRSQLSRIEKKEIPIPEKVIPALLKFLRQK